MKKLIVAIVILLIAAFILNPLLTRALISVLLVSFGIWLVGWAAYTIYKSRV